MGNRKAWCRTSGGIFLDSLTEMDVERHVQIRKAQVGPQSIRHDLMIMALLLNKLRKWKRKGYALDGFRLSGLKLPDFNPLEDVKRPRTKPRQILVSPDQFAIFCEHASDKMETRAIYAIDTGMNECDLRKLRVGDYNSLTNSFEFYRSKTGVWQSIPVSKRCREILVQVVLNGKDLILDWTNHINELRKIRLKTKQRWQWRDLRKSNLNEAYRKAGNDIKPAQRLAGHTDPKTTWTHYIVDRNEDLRPLIRHIERKYS